MRFLCFFLILTLPAIAQVKAKWTITEYQNEDGSWGKDNKEILTSTMVLAFLTHGETHTSKHFGEEVKNGFKYLTKATQKSLKTRNFTISDAYMLWALSEAYAMTRIVGLGENVQKLTNKILQNYEKKGWKDLSQQQDHFLLISSIALKASVISGVEYNKGLPKAYLDLVRTTNKAAQPDHLLSIVNSIAVGEMWGEKPVLTFNGSSIDPEKLQEIVKELTSSKYTIRNKAIEKTLDLSKKDFLHLMKIINDSDNFDLKITGKLVEKKWALYNTLDKSDDFLKKKHETIKKAVEMDPFNLYLMTAICFHKGGEPWRQWNNYFQKHLGNLQDKKGLWSNPDLKTPKCLNLKDKEKVIYNTALSALALTVYYRYLPSMKGAKGGR